jgi:hypothetical protein
VSHCQPREQTAEVTLRPHRTHSAVDETLPATTHCASGDMPRADRRSRGGCVWGGGGLILLVMWLCAYRRQSTAAPPWTYPPLAVRKLARNALKPKPCWTVVLALLSA